MIPHKTTVARAHCRAGLGFALLAAATATGCSTRRTVISQPIGQSASSAEAEPGGLVYSLPKSVVTVRGEQAANGTVTYAIAGSIVPDTTARFRLRHVASRWTDDDLNLQVDRNGLLTSSRANVTDRRAEVAVQLAKSAGAIVGAAPGLKLSDVPNQAVRPRAPVYPFTSVLEVDQLEAGAPLPDGGTITLRGLPDADRTTVPGPRQGMLPRCDFSICYRTVMHVTAAISAVGRPPTEIGIVLINPYRIEGIDLRGVPFVARTDALTFDSGLLTGQAVTVPSTAVAVASMPYNLLRGFFSAFGELLTIRVNNTNSEAGLIAAQTAILNNTRTQIEAERALQAARAQGQQTAPAVTGLGSPP